MNTYNETFTVEVVREKHTDRVVSIGYYDDAGRLHRPFDEPAFTQYDPATKKPVRLEYAFHGVEHRGGGKPSLQEIDPVTGVVHYERFYESGGWVQDGKIAVERDPKSGELVSVLRSESGIEIEENYRTESVSRIDLEP